MLAAMPAWARSAPTIIRDAEIESMLRHYMQPVFEAAGIGNQDVSLILISDPAVNAFVAGGQNIFLHTGLILETETPEELVGVLAHEAGHIAAGHLIRTRDVMENASFQTILATVIGIAAGIGAGSSDIATAAALGGQNAAMRSFLSHSRAQEASADQAAVRYLNTAGLSPKGLLTFLSKLEGEELLPPSQQSEYMRTHPLTRNRITFLETNVTTSPYYQAAFPNIWEEWHGRMQAKIQAFQNPEYALTLYGRQNKSFAARYARTIAYYRKNRMPDALEILETLIREEPQNPYLYELKGQILIENARVIESVEPFETAVQLRPESGLLRLALGHALIQAWPENHEHLKAAVEHLSFAQKNEPRSSHVHRLLATAYGKLGNNALLRLHLAEEAVLSNDTATADRQLGLAMTHIEKGTPAWLRAQDLKNFLEKDKE